jgi:hypothetical protein
MMKTRFEFKIFYFDIMLKIYNGMNTMRERERERGDADKEIDKALGLYLVLMCITMILIYGDARSSEEVHLS